MKIKKLQLRDSDFPVEQILAFIREGKIKGSAILKFNCVPHPNLFYTFSGEVDNDIAIKVLGLEKKKED